MLVFGRHHQMRKLAQAKNWLAETGVPPDNIVAK
jgi:hypothetical protein